MLAPVVFAGCCLRVMTLRFVVVCQPIIPLMALCPVLVPETLGMGLICVLVVGGVLTTSRMHRVVRAEVVVVIDNRR